MQIQFDVTDDDSGVKKDTISLQIDAGTMLTKQLTKISVIEGYHCTYVTALKEGVHILRIKAEDRDGNAIEKIVTFKVDTTAPSLNISEPSDHIALNVPTYVYIATATEGKTIRTITMIVNRRQRPEDYTVLPEKNLLREILERLDLKADDIKLTENELQLLSGGKGIGSKIRLPGGSGGREIELRNNGTAIQWRYTDSNDWIDLIQTEELRGKDGVTPSFIIRDGHLIAIYEEKEK